MSPRTGAQYLDSLNDDREVYIDGERVTDLVSHPAFAKVTRSFARLYDHQCEPEHTALMTFASPGTGRPVNRAWQIPRDRDELVERRRALTAWAELSFGMLGRAPDHVATSLGGMVAGVDALRAFPGMRADNLVDYFKYARDNDLFVSYVINNPQSDKTATSAQKVVERSQVLAVVDEDAQGIVVRGAKMLGTSAVMANELFVGTVSPLRPDESVHAVSFAVPLASPGLKLLSRKSYEAHAGSSFDYPLSAHFDENDCLVWFENVRVPWDRVFLTHDVPAARAQWINTPAHAYHNYQSQIRFAVKMRFLTGLARRIAEVNGSIDLPPVRTALARLGRQANIVEGMVLAAEADGQVVNGHYFPSAKHTYSALSYAQEIYPACITQIRDISGGGVLMLPSSVLDFGTPELAGVINAIQRSPSTSAESRVRTFRLAWDAIGSEFASRHTQYEMFYGGASFAVDANVYRTHDWSAATRLVDDALALSGGLEDAVATAQQERALA